MTIFLYNSFKYSGLSLKIYTEGVAFNLVLHSAADYELLLSYLMLSYHTKRELEKLHLTRNDKKLK